MQKVWHKSRTFGACYIDLRPNIGANAELSTIIYSIVKNAKTNNLKLYNYYEYLLEEIMKHMENMT
ncbi:MAG: hypothetical protein Q4F06_03090 [Eubacteriales bacterium]|nr:hypothetical protein [Eubacteriales bacterium]